MLAALAVFFAVADLATSGRAQTVESPDGGGTLVIISGNAQAAGANLPGANVVVANPQFVVNSVLTDANGNYSIDVVAGNNYTVSIFKDGYNFNPAYKILNNAQTNQVADFQNGTLLCVPASAGQSGGNYCQNVVGTAASIVQNGKIAFERSSSTFVMNADGSNQMQIPQGGHFPSWSPDGAKIVFNRTPSFENDEEIFSMNADGSNATRITVNNEQDFQARYSPNGAKIVFVRFANFNNEIYTMNADGRGEARLTDNSDSDLFPSFSPDGAKILFASDRVNGGGSAAIFTMNADGSNQTRLTFDDEFTLDYYPAWSPDNTKIIFRSNRGDGYVELWRMNADGGGLTQVTTDLNFNETQPTYSPDGTKIAFGRESNAGELNDIFTISAANGGGLANLTNTASQNEEYPSWQPVRSSVGATLAGNLSLTFSNVTSGGNTVATSIVPASAGALPFGYYLIPESVAYDVRTSAQFAGNIELCFNVPNVNDSNLFNNLVIFHNENGELINRTSSRNFAARKICATVTNLSPFVVAAPTAPTAASVTVSGRVFTPAGRGLMNAVVSMTDANGTTHATRTSSFGYYRFDEVEAGQSYILNVSSKRYQFIPQFVTLTESLEELDFVGE